ncbi:glycosyltransferase family 2 protein [Methanolacinia paynteri]|uniref:glycosyltransferase family 2 protein n=1 Tax=Methanolacinia paynteri TaxID=230356 RepID=UPI00064FC155|nr:glycosyltransferase family 2 protein [Methanolacinia paynteri]
MISIVIPNYNGKKFLENCLNSISGQSYSDSEIIVIDNGSSDGSAEYIKENFQGIILIENNENLGFTGATNQGIRQSNGEYILTLNNDTISDPSLLENLHKAIISDENIGIVASKMIFPDGRINSAGMCISRSGAAWNRGMFEKDQGQYEDPEYMIGACAGAALYRRSMLDEIGLFDEDFFMYHDDVDLSFRAYLAGWKCLYCPKAIVTHINSATSGFESEFSVYHGNRNIIWFAVKNFPARHLILYSPWIIGRSIGVIPHYILRKKTKIILKSKWDAFKKIPYFIRKRKEISIKIPMKKVSKNIFVFAHINSDQ